MERSNTRQPDLFGPAAEPMRPVYVPKREHVLNPLVEMLAQLRAAESWPWEPVVVQLKRDHAVPHLLRHLPEDEAAVWRADLDAEFARLDAAAG